MASPSSHHSGGDMHQVIQDVLHKLKSQGLSAHFPAAFQECVSVVGTVPVCQEDRVPMDPDCDHTSCYYPKSMVIIPREEVFIRGLRDLIKDCPKWSINRLIRVCISRLHHHHGAAGIIAVLTCSVLLQWGPRQPGGPHVPPGSKATLGDSSSRDPARGTHLHPGSQLR